MDDFNFFLKLAKPLVLNLPNAKDRAMAALWLKKLCQAHSRPSEIITSNDASTAVEHLKLLLFAMQENRLTGIFAKPPPSDYFVHQLVLPGQRNKATDMISMVESRTSSSTPAPLLIANNRPRVVTSMSGDECEYVAVQEIPNFGIHGYYVISTEPLSKWRKPLPRPSALPQSTSSGSLKTSPFDYAAMTKKGENGGHLETTLREDGKASKNLTANKDKKLGDSKKTLRELFPIRRSEIEGAETRPCWRGTNRYIDRLIDESPHLVADLDLSEADALLHLYHGRKFRKITRDNDQWSKACGISSRRREVEMRLDIPPCASFSIEDHSTGYHEAIDIAAESRTCLPRNIHFDNNDAASDCPYDEHEATFGGCSINNEDYCPSEYSFQDNEVKTLADCETLSDCERRHHYAYELAFSHDDDDDDDDDNNNDH